MCGCDKVNYWNDCLRRQAGVASSVDGECASSAPCDGLTSMQCPVARAFCAHLLDSDNDCGTSDAFGACWVVPEVCPSITVGGRYQSCESNQCLNKCQAIKSEQDLFFDLSCGQGGG